MASQMSCSPSLISAAIEQLVATQRRNIQKDGVVYDFDGDVIAVDPERSSGINVAPKNASNS